MNYVSLFAGIGGFDLALECLGHICVYVNDIDKYTKITYDKHFSKQLTLGDIRAIKSTNIPDHDLLVGGFPCQSFSVAGKRGGFTDTRGTLFFEIARILKEKQPRLFILENVKGLLSHEDGKTFTIIITALDELGYDLQWQVLNSKDFGVPQNRERVFIVGNLRGTPRPEVFPIDKSKRLSSKGITPEREEVQNSTTITSNYAKGVHNGGETYVEVASTLMAKEGGPDINQTYVRDLTRVEEGVFPTLRNGGKGGVPSQRILKDMQIRRLTPIECERLQGFPDNWTAGISDTQRYKQLGNAVTVNVVYEIAKRL